MGIRNNKKGAIGLAMNIIVILIISVVILTGGILFIQQLIGGAEDIKAQLDQKTEDEIQRLITDQGKKVALPLHTVTIEAGNNHVFGLGILNLPDSGGDRFKIIVGEPKVLRPDDSVYTSEELDEFGPNYGLDWVLFNLDEMLISENQYRSEPLLVNVPKNAKKGTYIYNVQVNYNNVGAGETIWPQYDNIKKFYVTVK